MGFMDARYGGTVMSIFIFDPFEIIMDTFETLYPELEVDVMLTSEEEFNLLIRDPRLS